MIFSIIKKVLTIKSKFLERMKKILGLLTIYFIVTLLLFLLGCAGAPPVERKVERVPVKPSEVPRQVLCLALIWNGEIPRAGEANSQTITNLLALLERYPQINMTFNLSPEMVENMSLGAVDICKRLQDSGRIEVAMVPPGRPVLPLLYDTDLAGASMPVSSLPLKKYRYPEDVRARIMEGVSLYRNYFGSFPQGIWPPEGAVAQEVLDIVSDCRLEWMVSGEEVLENSLDIELTRDDQGRLLNPEFLYRPYRVSGEKKGLTMIFRDGALSDRINSVYPMMSGDEAVNDLMEYLYFIQKQWKQNGPPLVTIIIDNEESIYFLSQLFNRIEDIASIKTIILKQYLEKHPPVLNIKKLWPGSLVNANFDSWIGEEEENIAWELLAEARINLENYKNSGRANIEELDQAFATILKASDSKWFWWYGRDQNSGRDEIFDQEFRSLLIGVYQAIGIEPPGRLFQPIVVQKNFLPSREIADLVTPEIDGIIDKGEWDNAGYYVAEGC